MILGTISGYIGGKATVVAMALTLWTASAAGGAAMIICPATIPVLAPLVASSVQMAEAASLMVLSPICPVSSLAIGTVVIPRSDNQIL